jgi:GntR family transcriptional regulator/MocR family aminotransferase
MLPYSTIISIDRNMPAAIYKQIAGEIINAIRNGVIKPGARLPGTRSMGKLLGVHRKTVIAAYDELYGQNWIEMGERRGAIVPEKLPQLQPLLWGEKQDANYAVKMSAAYYPLKGINYVNHPVPSPLLVIDDGHCDTRLAPITQLTRMYRNCADKARFQKVVTGPLAAGAPALREALVSYLAETRGLQLSITHLLITQGAQMALYIAVQLLLRSGDAVAMGSPGYYMANHVFLQAGAKLIAVKVDENGMDMDELEEACKQQKIKVVYVIPHHHHPTTVTLSPERRMRLLKMSQEHDFMIIEDDYDYEFHYSASPYLPLASSGHHGRVIYIGSFSKSLASSVRIGFMTGPAEFIEDAVKLRRLIDLRGDHLMEEALAELIASGDFGRHLKKSNKIYLQRRDLMCAAIAQHFGNAVKFSKPNGGMAVWVQFNPQLSLKHIAAEAARHKLFISNGEMFNTPQQNFNATRFGFASLNPNEIEEAMELLGNIVNRQRMQAHLQPAGR